MKPAQIAEFKAVHRETLRLLENMKYDISLVEVDFLDRLEMIAALQGALIERVEGEQKPQREIGYDSLPFHVRF